MIPREIHFCWFGDREIPEELKEIVKEWKELFPDFKIVRWGNFELAKIPDKPKYVIDAIKQKKWAFVSDYVRIYALYKRGGWYFDTDMKIISPFLYKYENHRCVSAVEIGGTNDKHDGIQIQAAFIGSEKGHPYMKDILDYYSSAEFVYDDEKTIISPIIYAKVLEKYGFDYDDGEQALDEDIFLLSWKNILPHISHLMKTAKRVGDIYAVHQCFHSWVNEEWGINKGIINLIDKIKRINKRQ